MAGGERGVATDAGEELDRSGFAVVTVGADSAEYGAGTVAFYILIILRGCLKTIVNGS